MSRTRQLGFTLIEMMITVAVIGILAAVAFPSYQSYIDRANRSAAQSFMMGIANKQQQFLLDARTFAGDPNALTTLGLTVPADVSTKYSFTVTCTMPVAAGACTAAAGAPNYIITASPSGGQVALDANYGKCGDLTLNAAGTKGKTGTSLVADCWKG